MGQNAGFVRGRDRPAPVIGVIDVTPGIRQA
jgi:hypothetical protein